MSGGGGKQSTSTQGVTIPASVLAQYNSVNSRATSTANTPFQTYGGQFVAPVNSTQQTGISGTTAGANEAQPAFAAATTGLNATQSATAPVNAGAEAQTAANSSGLTGQQINQYLSPYLGNVLGSTEAIQNQENQEQQAGQLGTAISSGAFGGDRTGIAAANLAQQQQLANNQTIAGIANQGYQSALGTAQTEQGIGLQGAAQQASIGQTAYGEGANTASELAGLGSGAQSAALQGAQAEIGAGTVQQQTQQAQDTALYNQFLQQQSYPFQVDQFLANIAEGTGALSGSTTTTTQPGGFFSDKRLKYDIKKVGKTFDGQEIYSYKMHGDPRTHIGLIAQKVEKKHPHAVGLAAGYKTVDYGKATEDAANRGHFFEGGIVPRQAYAGGGPSIVDPSDLSAILQAQQQMYAPYSGGASGVYGGEGGTVPRGGSSRVPAPSGAHPSLVVAQGSPQPAPSGASNTSQAIGLGEKGYGLYKKFSGPSGGGVSPATQAAAVNEGPAAPAAGVAPVAPAADTAAAAEGPAADVGATTAADAAGTAAAGAGDAAIGAAAGDAAGAGAADAAAALAAEYAAADVATAAVIAAKRGGRIGLGAGGSPYSGIAADDPYSSAGGGLDIPSDQNTSQLKTAGPLKKIPTGFQDVMSMSNPMSIGTNVGNMFSNEALARGGIVPRGGYADGGSPNDADPTADPDVAPPPAKGGGIGGWWDRNKGNVLPILSGLAAAGTAKTVHPGVALAAGLEAAAGNYVPTQEGLAQVKGQQIQNQIAQQKLNYLTSPDAPAASAPSVSPSAGTYSPADLRKQYYVPPVTPQENASLQSAYKKNVALNSTQPSDAIKASIQNRVAAAISANQNDARQNYDDAYSVYNSAKDPALKSSAAAVANAYQQWTGDRNEVRNGVPTNTRTNQPWIGDEAARISTQKYADLMNQALEKKAVPTGVPGETTLMPMWQINGARSAADYVSSLVPPGTPGISPVAATSAAPVQARRPAADGAPKAPAVAPVATQSQPLNPVDAAPFADPKYKLSPIPTKIGTTASTAVANQVEATSAARAALQKDAEDTAQTAGASLQFAKAAKQIMDSQGAPITGLFGPAAKAISSAFGGVDATNYQEVAKYLGNLSVQSSKSNFSHTTDKNTGIQFEQLNPSTANTSTALSDLLDSNVRIGQYTLDTANRATGYLDPNRYNGDPQKFFRWNQEHYPRADVVNPADTIPVVKSKADYDALPKGGKYSHNGKIGVKQ